jgi:hypothetical protein
MKVGSAQVCLDCDELFVGKECPVCLGRTSIPLRRWFLPLMSFEDRKEVHDAAKKVGGAVKKTSQDLLVSAFGATHRVLDPTPRGGKIFSLPKVHKAGSNQSTNQNKPSQSKIGEGYHPCREQGESESYIKQRCNWFNAGYACIRKVICRKIKGAVERHRTQHSGRVQDPEALSEYQPEFADSFKKI